jgi:hypothetical protein
MYEVSAKYAPAIVLLFFFWSHVLGLIYCPCTRSFLLIYRPLLTLVRTSGMAIGVGHLCVY